MRGDEMRDEDPTTTLWRGLLTGTDPTLLKMRARWRHVPSAPRCKVCASPFHGIGGAFARLFWHGPMRDNPLLCKACFGKLAEHAGGAEIEISVVFADVRGSTALAERTSASEYRGLIQAYYRSAAIAIDENGGIIDKFLGDGVMALFIPVISGENHAARAIKAGRAILAAVERDGLTREGPHGRGGRPHRAGVRRGRRRRREDRFHGPRRHGQHRRPTREPRRARMSCWSAAPPGIEAGLGSPPAERDVEIAGRIGNLAVVATGAALEPVG